MIRHDWDSDEFREWMQQTGRKVFDVGLAEAFAAGQSLKTEIVAWLVGEQTITGGIACHFRWDRGVTPKSIGFEAVPLRALTSRLEETKDLF